METTGRRRDSPQQIEELIQIALTVADEDLAWAAVATLHARGTRDVLEAATSLCSSAIDKERELGANILAQLGTPRRTFPAESFECLAALLARESSPLVLQAIAVAFGHLGDRRCTGLLLPLKNHPNANVRCGVVHGLSGQDEPAAIQALIELCRDQDQEVRDWATFGISTFLDADSSEIRAVLWERASDLCTETRLEALVGLARRKDPRAIDPILKELNAEPVADLAIEAAMASGDPRLGPALLAIKERWTAEGKYAEVEWLDGAIAACKDNTAQDESAS